MAMRSTADCRCGLVVRPVRRCERGQQRVDHPRHRRLAVGARDVDRRIPALRRAEQLHQRRDAGRARFELGLRPPLIEQMLDLEQRRDLVRGRDRARSSQSTPAWR